MDCGTWYGNRPAGPGRGAGGNPRGIKKQRRDGRTDTWQRTMTRPPPRPPCGTRGGAGAPAPERRDGAKDSDGEQRRREARRRERVSLAHGRGRNLSRAKRGRRAGSCCQRPPGHCGGDALSRAHPWRGRLRRPPPFAATPVAAPASTPRYPYLNPDTPDAFPEQSPRDPLRATRGAQTRSSGQHQSTLDTETSIPTLLCIVDHMSLALRDARATTGHNGSRVHPQRRTTRRL